MNVRILGVALLAGILLGCSPTDKVEPKKAGEVSTTTPAPAPAPAPAEAARPADPPKEAKPTSAELLQRAQQAIQQKNMDAAIAPLEELVAAEPKNRQGLFMLAGLTQQKAQETMQAGNTKDGNALFLKSADYAKKLRAAHPGLNPNEKNVLLHALYNEACAEALQGQVDKALAALKDCVESGWNDMDHIDKDKDFDGIRKDPKFVALHKELSEKIASRSLENTRKLLAEQKPFDFDFTLPNLDGKKVSKKDFAGKILIVDIWGTWCGPCKMEIPHFIALHKKYQKDGLEIVGINYENVKDQVAEHIRKFAKENKISYPCLIGDEKTKQQVPDFRGFPTTLFFDRTGKLRLSLVGARPHSELEGIVKVLLDEKQTVQAKE
jgi:thiol-disulfide isomerase/thioredoxin